MCGNQSTIEMAAIDDQFKLTIHLVSILLEMQ